MKEWQKTDTIIAHLFFWQESIDFTGTGVMCCCKFHKVFAPRSRRKELYNGKRLDIKETLRKFCARKGVKIIV